MKIKQTVTYRTDLFFFFPFKKQRWLAEGREVLLPLSVSHGEMCQTKGGLIKFHSVWQKFPCFLVTYAEKKKTMPYSQADKKIYFSNPLFLTSWNTEYYAIHTEQQQIYKEKTLLQWTSSKLLLYEHDITTGLKLDWITININNQVILVWSSSRTGLNRVIQHFWVDWGKNQSTCHEQEPQLKN